MKYPKTFKRYILNLCEIFRVHTFTIEYKIAVKFSEQPREGKGKDTDAPMVVADMMVYPEYLEAELTIYPRLLDIYRRKTYAACADAICHEHCHILFWPIANLTVRRRGVSKKVLSDVTEQQVQRITNAILTICRDTDWSPEQVRKAGK